MKLWEKNYLITCLLLVVVLNAGIVLLSAYSFHGDLKSYVNRALEEKRSISYMVSNLYSVKSPDFNLNYMLQRYRASGIQIRLMDGRRVIFNTIDNDKMVEMTDEQVNIIREGGTPFLCVEDQVESEGSLLQLVYFKDLKSFYEQKLIHLWVWMLLSIGLSSMFLWILYVVLKNLYRPVENIAHELRTPLTSIKGYAQYVRMAKLSEEEHFFAIDEILSEANNLQGIVEKLLIMGNLRTGQLKLEWITMDNLFFQLQEFYPKVIFCGGDFRIKGDVTLLKSLLGNLISNGVRAGEQVTVTAFEDGGIQVHNDGAAIAPKLLRLMNRNGILPAEQIHGSGRGLPLCHEIAKLHGGKLTFLSGTAGTEAVVRIPTV